MMTNRSSAWLLAAGASTALALAGCAERGQHFSPAPAGSFSASPNNLINPGGGGGGGGGDAHEARLVVVEGSTLDFGSVPVFSYPGQALTLRNVGDGPATAITGHGLADPFSFRGGSFPGFGGTCGPTLAAGAQCVFQVQYAPRTLERHSGQAVVSYESGRGGRDLALQLKGSSIELPTLLFERAPSYAFGQTQGGTGVLEARLVVRHFGLYPATEVKSTDLLGDFSYKGGSYPGTGGDCGTRIAKDCSVVIVFKPSRGGAFSQPLKLTYNNGAYRTDAAITLGGTATDPVQPPSPASLQITRADIADGGSGTVSFGSVGVGQAQVIPFRVRNTGGQAATAVSVQGFSSSAYSVSGGGCPAQLAAGAECQLQVRFLSSVAGTFSSQLGVSFVRSAGAAAQVAARALTGFAGNRPRLTIEGDGSFGTVPAGSTLDRTFVVRNAATSLPASGVNVLDLPAGSGFTVRWKSCPSGLPTGGSCSLIVRFQPTAADHPYAATLRVTHDDGEATKALSGGGSAGATLGIDTDGFDFGPVVVNRQTPVQGTLWITYRGGLNAATIQSVTEIRSDFGYQGGGEFSGGGTCGQVGSQINGPAGTRCSVLLTFQPTEVRAYRRDLLITYADGTGATKTLTAVIRGRGIDRGSLTLEPSPLVFEETKTGGQRDALITARAATGDHSTITIGTPTLSGDAAFTLVSGGTCSKGVFLKPGEACTFKIRFSPTQAGPAAATQLKVLYNNGLETDAANPAVADIRGTAYSAAALAFDPETLDLGKVLVRGTTKPGVPAGPVSKTIQLVNKGTDGATGVALDDAALAGLDLRVKSNGCSDTLAAGASCAIEVEFDPTRPGQRKAADGGRILLVARYVDARDPNAKAEAEVAASGVVPVRLGVGGDHSCAITELGELKCWGRNGSGQLGLGSGVGSVGSGPGQMGSKLKAVDLGEGHWAVDVALGAFHTCAVLETRQLKCWGRNDSGQLGIGSIDAKGLTADDMKTLPVVQLGQGVRQVSAGFAHTCAILDDGSAKCWGLNDMGQLGAGSSEDAVTSPMAVLLPAPIQQISAGTGHTCAVSAAGELRCFGNNFFGQLGFDSGASVYALGRTSSEMSALKAIDLGPGRKALAVQAATGGTTCALLDDASVKCFGTNLAVEDFNPNQASSVAREIKGMLGTHWALDGQGQAVPSWDPAAVNPTNRYGRDPGQMGSALPPVELGTGFEVAKISSGNFFTCAVSAAGGVKCFGDNVSGQLGQGDTNARGDQQGEMGSSLAEIPFAATPVQVSAGNMHACALFADESVRCWGNNAQGQLGRGNMTPIGTQPGEIAGLQPVALQ